MLCAIGLLATYLPLDPLGDWKCASHTGRWLQVVAASLNPRRSRREMIDFNHAGADLSSSHNDWTRMFVCSSASHASTFIARKASRQPALRGGQPRLRLLQGIRSLGLDNGIPGRSVISDKAGETRSSRALLLRTRPRTSILIPDLARTMHAHVWTRCDAPRMASRMHWDAPEMLSFQPGVRPGMACWRIERSQLPRPQNSYIRGTINTSDSETQVTRCLLFALGQVQKRRPC